MRKILAIGLDAAEWSLIQKWTADGSMPHLKLLLETGTSAPLDSFARHLPGSVWYNFYMGKNPGTHGLYSYHIWRPQLMRALTPSASWLDGTTFWHHLQKDGARGLIFNVPSRFSLAPFNGAEIMSLASEHSLTNLMSHPAHLLQQVRQDIDHIHYSEEKYDRVTFKEFITTRDEMITLARTLGKFYSRMAKQERWDFLLAIFTSVHRAGHRLWSADNIKDVTSQAERDEAADALRQVYIACDQAIGELVDTTGSDTIRLLFSFHGMHKNHSREAILPELLNRVVQNGEAGGQNKKIGGLQKARMLVPLDIRHRIKSMLPLVWRQRLTIFWRLRQMDWSRTRAFVIPLEVKIGVRINLKGRERRGIVEPGKEYEELCQKIIEGLSSFMDADTGKPLVQELHFARAALPGERADWLPDLIGSWNDDPSAEHRLITSPMYGDVPWQTPGQNPEGRSGNHTNEGFLIVQGQGVRKILPDNVSILDLAPTILALLGEPIPPELEGKILPLLEDV